MNSLNRDLKRSMAIKQHHKKQIITLNSQQIMHRQHIKNAIDEGIWMGFKAASDIFEKAARSVPGIGDKRIVLILDKVHEHMEDLKNAASRSKTKN